MIAYLTFTRKHEQDYHMIGIKNPINIKVLSKYNLISGQPIICTIQSNKIISLYLISRTGNIFQVFGDEDSLFTLDNITDISYINIKKYNGLGYYLQTIFNSLSIKEFEYFKTKLEKFENDLFYQHLHTELEISKIKGILIKEINKLDIEITLKRRFILALRNSRIPSKKILRRKVDIDLSAYSVYINTFVS